MNFAKLLKSTEKGKLLADAKRIASAQGSGLLWNKSVEIILTGVAENPEHAPKKLKADTAAGLLEKWLRKYTTAYNHRISTRVGNEPGTIADPILETIISCRLPHLKAEDLIRISFGHRLSMSAENILGLLLEEYLAVELAPHKWHCCWGETLRSIDFVNEDGRLLQVKNRSNSENSSSSRVRDGTQIEKWFRVNATSGKYLWEELNIHHKPLQLSEKKFVAFVVKTLKANPKAMPVEPENPWK